jgi:hypothetical protein
MAKRKAKAGRPLVSGMPAWVTDANAEAVVAFINRLLKTIDDQHSPMMRSVPPDRLAEAKFQGDNEGVSRVLAKVVGLLRAEGFPVQDLTPEDAEALDRGAR